MTRKARVRLGDDSGASLVIALLFVTVVALVIGAVLSIADSNFRATVALRNQSAQAAAADGAAQLAIDALRHGTYNGQGGACFGSGAGASNTLDLSGFAAATSPMTATVTCQDDDTKSFFDDVSNAPGRSLLTLGGAADGIYLDINGAGGDKVYLVSGKVHSNSNIRVFKGILKAGSTSSVSGCTGGTAIQPACTTAATVADPDYKVPDIATYPTTKAADPTPSTCSSGGGSNKRVTFSPGRYSTVSVLNDITNKGNCTIFYFKPGVYYFNYSGTWTVGKGTLFAGSPKIDPPSNTAAPTIGNSCYSPIPPDPKPAGWDDDVAHPGAQFVFGGSAKMDVTNGSGIEICGRNVTADGSGPPIAIYGLKQTLNAGTGDEVLAQSPCGPVITTCATLHTDKNSDLPFYVQGTTYLPYGALNLEFKKDATTYFRYGVVANYFRASGPGNSAPTTPAIDVPTRTPQPARTVVYLTVRLCPNGGACGAGAVRLRAKVAIGDPNGQATMGKREISVLNWSVQR